LKLLAVETALGACSVAVLEGEKILAHQFEEMTRGHAERLAPMVEKAMQDAEIGFAALDGLAVTTGPGTFTGQRVGLAFMRGLRVALKKPLTGITTLEAMAAATRAARAAAIHDAKRGEAYLLLWEEGETVLPPTVMPFADAVSRIRAFGSCALAGTGAPAAAAALGEEFELTHVRQPDALWVARLAMVRPSPEGPPAPLYLRAPDAKLPAPPGIVANPRRFDPATDDIAALAGLHSEAFSVAWSAAAIRDLFATPGVFAFASAEGFIMARAAGGEAEILTLAVIRAARRQGLGRTLVRSAAAHAERLGATSLFLEVGLSNKAAQALYRGLGFAGVGRRKAYYGDEDADVLKAALPLAPEFA
jgi:tRNA threonylcarbamoyladenosine biosynthesis protein TsaB